MIMSGSLAEWSVEDLLHLVRITEKTTSISLVGATRTGVIHLRDGAMVGVAVDPSSGDAGDDFSRAVDGIRALTELGEGSFEFGPLQLPEGGPAFDIDDLLAAVHKDVAREERVRALGITDEQPLALSELPSSAVTFQVQAWQLLAPLVPSFRLRDLDRRFGRGRAVATVLMLEALGVLDRGGAAGSGNGLVPSPLTVPQAGPPGTPLPSPLAAGADGRVPSGGGVESMEEDLPEPEVLRSGESGDPRGMASGPPVSDSQATAPPPASLPRRPTVVDPGETLGAHYVEVFDDPAGAGIVPAEGGPTLTLVPDVLDDLRSRFRTGPSRIDSAIEGELDDD